MRIIIYLCMMFMSFEIFGQLKGAVPQSTVPEHINDDRKVENNSAKSAAKNNADKMKKTLKLSEKQYGDLYKALLTYETDVEKTSQSNLSKKDQFDKMNKLNISKQEKLKAILSKEQYHAYIMSFP
ncbi:MAG: hypothetical protein IPL55_21305 [Saprospiraceae bacterium]|nr:hypothetical protein [Saprospiraceae bacterium]MBL0026616.1 hypothetical protein [Saprospiraceae bacterium]